MNHPPTTCDRSLFLDEHSNPLVITDGDIQKAVSWYEQHRERLKIFLPGKTISGVTYKDNWLELFDTQTLPAYHSNRLRDLLVRVYVLLALRRVRRGLRERASP